METSAHDEPSQRAAPAPAGWPDWVWGVWAVTAAFGCYFCMYGFRRPFTAATFSDMSVAGLSFKTALVTSQVLGYMISKFVGIKIIAEMPPQRRAATLLGLVLSAEAALVLFGLTPRPWNAALLFLNGLPLGMVFGLVLSFLEGRRMTEALVAGLCASFILADGVTKSAGAWLLSVGVSEDWMPATAGLMFLAPLGVCVAMLSRIPPPNARDVAARAPRETMNRAQRWNFVYKYAAGLLPLVGMYLAVTIVRSIRADFAPELWRDLGHVAVPSIFTRTELWVTLGVLAVNGSAVLIVDNQRAFFAALAACGLGFGLLATALAAQQGGYVSSFNFMVLLGLGLYLPYVAVHTTIFERLLSLTPERGNLGFLMYLADAIGYLGYVAVMIARNMTTEPGNVLGLLTTAGWITLAVSIVCLLQSGQYFARLAGRARVALAAEEPA